MTALMFLLMDIIHMSPNSILYLAPMAQIYASLFANKTLEQSVRMILGCNGRLKMNHA